MIAVLTPEQMRAADADAVAAIGDDALMAAAGMAVALHVRGLLGGRRRVVAFAGPGNNGGDAFAALAELPAEIERIVYAAPAATVSPARAAATARAQAAGVTIAPLPDSNEQAEAALEDAIGIDALFGTGSRLPIPEPYAALASALDGRRHAIVAVDLPSGIDALTGAVATAAVHATHTIALGAAKPGLYLDPARDYVGELWIAPIAFDPALLLAHQRGFAALDDEECARLLPVRASESDKRASGAPLIVAGSTQFPGAAVLCARAAARAGAGYVTVATPRAVAPTLRAHLIEQVVVELAEERSVSHVVDELLEIATHNGSVGIGPGLGLDAHTGGVVVEFLRRNTLPAVVDASALFHLAKHLDVLRGKPVVLTPHAGEFARLSGRGTVAPGERVERLREFVARTGVTTLLKGRTTLIDDGTTVHLNATGCNALATAGTGDVLTGTIATLMSQGVAPVDAARLGAYWHGLAGQVAARRRPVGAIAGDVLEALPESRPWPSSVGAAEVRRLF